MKPQAPPSKSAYMPWENVQFLPIGGMPFPFTQKKGEEGSIQYGIWKEYPHKHVLRIKQEIASSKMANEWELKKKITNPFEAIFSGTDESIFPSLAAIVPLSRSYFKMIELFYLANPNTYIQKTPIQTAHVCEGPGGFIQYLVEQKGRVSASHAMTLKPIRSHIPGWRHSVQFLKQHPEIVLHYGKDGTGNILNPENQVEFCKNAKGSHFFTADGGFDFSKEYSEQEFQVFPLLLASFLIGLQSLAQGGVCIIKIFDMYSPATQDLLIGTATYFDTFTIYKPATSRPCNSERYFIGRGYLGIEKAQKWIQHLVFVQKEIFTKKQIQRIVSFVWPPNITQALFEQIHWQEQLQIKSIEDTLYLKKEDIPKYIAINLEQSKRWCTQFQVPMKM